MRFDAVGNSLRDCIHLFEKEGKPGELKISSTGMKSSRTTYFFPNCQKATALAAATFKESTSCDIGILTV